MLQLDKHGLFILIIGSSLLVSGVAPDQAGAEDSLSLSVWEVYSDAVILDWYITLSMKFRMSSCQISFGRDEDGDTEAEETVRNWVPDHRSFQVGGLSRNTSYWLVMSCTDTAGTILNSSLLRFTTEEADEQQPKYSHIIQDDFQQSRAQGKGLEFRNPRPATVKRREMSLSPHALLGLGCGLLLFVITVATVGLVCANYVKYNNQTKQPADYGAAPGSPAYGDVPCREGEGDQVVSISWDLEMADMCQQNKEDKEDKLIDI